MRILFLSHYFPPEMNAPANRVYEHARRWVADGHEVTVITCVPNHPRGELYPGYRNGLLQEERKDGIRVLRVWTYLTPNEGFFKRTANYVLFALAAILASLRQPRPDVVVATSPQFFCGMAGAVVSRLKRAPFVLEVRDLWPESIVALGQLRQPTLIRLLEWVESRLYRSAAGIVSVTRSFVEHIAQRGVPRERIGLIYNGIDRLRFRPRPPDPALLAANGLEDRFRVAYIGTLGLAHGLGTVVEAAERRPDIDFLLIGDGADRARIAGECEKRGLTNLHMLGLRPRDEIPAWIASIDILLVMLRDLPVFETVIPSKMFEFLAQERPVIVAARGETRQLIQDAKAAFVVDPENTDQLVEALDTIRQHPEEAAARARAGREMVENDFDREVLARRMADFLQGIVDR